MLILSKICLKHLSSQWRLFGYQRKRVDIRRKCAVTARVSFIIKLFNSSRCKALLFKIVLKGMHPKEQSPHMHLKVLSWIDHMELSVSAMTSAYCTSISLNSEIFNKWFKLLLSRMYTLSTGLIILLMMDWFQLKSLHIIPKVVSVHTENEVDYWKLKSDFQTTRKHH